MINKSILELKKEYDEYKQAKLKKLGKKRPVDIKNLYIWDTDDISYIVRLEETTQNYEKNIVDFFTDKVLDYKLSDILRACLYMKDPNQLKKEYPLIPISKILEELNQYESDIVPYYVLEDLHYQLNIGKIKSQFLKKR